jgi:hypothetical protein
VHLRTLHEPRVLVTGRAPRSSAALSLACTCIAVVLLASCAEAAHGTRASTAERDWDIRAPYAGIDFPLQSLIESGLGYSRQEVYGAALDRKGTVVRTCLADRGFVAAENEVPSSAIQRSGAAKVFGGATSVALDTLEQITRDMAKIRPQRDFAASSIDSARSIAIDECYAEARELPDPYQLLNDYLEESFGGVEDAVLADSRVVEADARSTECFGRLGYSATNESELSSLIVDRANAILMSVVEHRIDETTAKSQLADLATEEDAVEDEATACFYERDRIHAIARSELERSFIDANGERLRQLIDETRQAVLSDYSSYLLEPGA